MTAMMRGNAEEETYSVFLFLIGEQGRDNTTEWDKKVNAQGNQAEDDITVKKFFKRFEEYCLPEKNLVVERKKFFWKNQHYDETFDQFMTELRNLASTCEFGDLYENLLLYKVVDGIRSEKIRDVLLRKGVEMTLEKAINICHAEEITNMYMKEMNSEKEVHDITRNQKWKKAQKKKGGSGDRQKKENKKGSTQTMDGKGCKFCGRIHKPRECPAYGQECHKCKKKNHWTSCCMTKKIHEASTKSDDNFVIETGEAALKEKSTEALAILKINNKKVEVKLDAGAEVNVMLMSIQTDKRRSCQDRKSKNRNQNSMWQKQIPRE